jgi:serine phosphatase RsbU (regulator of sigma subunit)/Tfp pilus assembly protein PilF
MNKQFDLSVVNYTMKNTCKLNVSFMRRPGPIFLILFLSFWNFCNAQNSTVDSLKKILVTSREDSLKVELLISICKNENRSFPDSIIIRGTEALNLSEKLGYRKGIANSYKWIGMGHYFLANYWEAIRFWRLSLSSFEAINDKTGIANMLSNIGATYASQGDDVMALEFHLKSLKAAEEIKDTLRIVTSMINIGIVYLNKPSTLDVAIKYYLSALPLSEKLGDNDAIGTAAVNLGEIYFKRENYDSALFYYEKSLNAFQKSNSGYIPYTLSNIGKVYMKRGDFQKAVEFQQKGYEIAKQSDAKLEMTATLLGLAETYSEEGSINSAIQTYNKAREIAEEIRANNELKQAYEGLAESYIKMSDYANALKFQTLLTNIKDTLYLTANDNNLTSLSLNYELDKKVDQINLLTKDQELKDLKIKKQKFTQITFIIGFIIAILIATQSYRNYRRKVKTNELLAKQKNEIELQNKNLTISINYAERIQSAMFPAECILSPLEFEYFILFKPLDIVSGDFYWFKKNNNSFYIAAGDCTGHGVPGAFMSILGLTFLNELVHKDVRLNANEVLTRLREHIIRTLHQKNHYKSTRDGMEMALFILDPENNNLQFSGAKRPLYLIRDKQLNELAADKMPLGIYEDELKPFTNKEMEFKKNDIIYLFSDGYVDQLGGPDRKTFRTKRLKELLLNNCHLPMNEQKHVLEAALEEWKSGIEQIDDILVMGIKLKFGAVDGKTIKTNQGHEVSSFS